MAETSLVLTQGLTKRYGTFTALDDCTLAVDQGEVFGLLGPNGAGKTTLLRLLLAFLRPTAGWAKIDGIDCHQQPVAVHQRVAYLPGDASLPERMRGHAVLRFFSQVRQQGDLPRAQVIAQRLQLDLSRQVAQMSTGMRQKLALAAVLSIDAPVLILDEPTSNLDPTVRSEVLLLVREARQQGRTVLFSSHVMSEVEQVCDRVVILRGGRLVHTQVVSELLRQHRIRAELTGPLPPFPEHLDGSHAIQAGNGRLLIETPGELSPLLGWLAQAPIREVRIEPIGLQAVYERYHGADAE